MANRNSDLLNNPEELMRLAIEEARASLREGNSGFGAVVADPRGIVSRAHDTDTSSNDPTAHAEMNAIRKALAKIGTSLEDSVLVSTHEPCPMCSGAIVWSGIKRIAFGCTIREAMAQGRRRIDLPSKWIFDRAGRHIDVVSGVRKEECALLYDEDVRKSVKQLRFADAVKIERLADNLTKKRIQWFKSQEQDRTRKNGLEEAYHLFLEKLCITAEQAPIVERDADKIVIHSRNFCPTLEACIILNLDTRKVCRQLTESPTQELLKQLNPNLRFRRNYEKLRPYAPYCEEMILIENR